MKDTPPQVAALVYAPPGLGTTKRSIFPVVVLLGATPLVVGVTITILYNLTRWPALVMAGFITILAGVVCVLAGLGCLYIFWRREREAGRYSRDAIFLRVFLAAILLLSNFPAAVACMSSAWDTQTRLNIMVINEGSTRINSCVLISRGEQIELGPIGPGAKVSYSMKNPGGGSLIMTRSGSGGMITTTLIEYVDEDVRGDQTFVIDGDSTIGR